MLLLSSMLFAAREAGVSADVFTITDFSKTLDSKWHSKSLKGNTRYERVRLEQGTWALKAVARDTASLIIRRLKIEPDE